MLGVGRRAVLVAARARRRAGRSRPGRSSSRRRRARSSSRPIPNDAPKTVAHIVALVKRGFYDGQRIHRALPGFVVQWGDPQIARPGEAGRVGPRRRRVERHADRRRRDESKKRLHTKGAVAMAHPGDPAQADSQIYVTLARSPRSRTASTPSSATSSRATTCPTRLAGGRRDQKDVREAVTRIGRRGPTPASSG